MQSSRIAGALSAALALLLLLPGDAVRAQGVRIAAVVNDQIISIADFNARMQLILASSKIPDDPEIRSRIATQVMRQMIDEKLELQEAKKEDVKASPDEIRGQLAGLAQMNHLPADGLDKFLAEHHIDKATLVGKMTAELTWAKLVQERYGHIVNVSDDEVDEAYKELQAERNKPEYHVGEIFLSVESPDQDDDVHALADRLFEEIQRGARFQDVARQFSQSTAALDGDLGWVVPGMLDPDVDKIITAIDPGTMTRPVRLAGGYYIFTLIERRDPPTVGADVTVNLSQVVFPMAPNADAATRAATIKKAQAATTDARSCGEMAKIGRDISPDLSGPIGSVHLVELPQEIRPMILAAAIARPTDPVPVRGGIGVFMVCQRSGGTPAINRDQIENNLRNARLENVARGYLEDLRRVAYIDLRV